MKNEIKEKIIVFILMVVFIFGAVAIINYRIEQTQKIDTEVSIIENR